MINEHRYEADTRRYAGAFFGRGFQDTSMVILSPKPVPLSMKLDVIWQPFTASLWVVCAILFGFAIFVLAVAERNVVIQEQKNGDMRYHVMGYDVKSFIISAEAIIEQGPLQPTTIEGRAVREGFKFFVFFAYSIYVANLAAYLVVNAQGKAIYSLKDIQDEGCTVLMRTEEPQRRLMEKKYSYLKIKETKKVTSQGSSGAIVDVLQEENACAAIYPAMLGYKYLSLTKNCNIMLNPVSDDDFKFGGGFMTDSDNEAECKPNIFVTLNTLLLDMEVDGSLNSILMNYSIFNTGKDPASDECAVTSDKSDTSVVSSNTQVSIEQLGAVAIVAFIISLLCMFFVIYRKMYPHKGEKDKDDNVDWEHQSYPIDWQHQVFKKLLSDTFKDGNNSRAESDIARRRLSNTYTATNDDIARRRLSGASSETRYRVVNEPIDELDDNALETQIEIPQTQTVVQGRIVVSDV